MKNSEWQKVKQMDLDTWLNYVSEDDDLGLTAVKVKTSAPTSDEFLIAKFIEINDFVKKNGRLPENNIYQINELMLHKRLKSIKVNPQQCRVLVDFDELNLLPLTHEC